MGFICEGVIALRDIPYFEETEKFSISLPNKWNFAFYFPNVIRFYLLLGFFPMLYTQMWHMYNLRSGVKQLADGSEEGARLIREIAHQLERALTEMTEHQRTTQL